MKPSEIEGLIDKYSPLSREQEDTEFSRRMTKAWTILRRAERAAVKAGQFGRFSQDMLTYLNRLCDYIKVVSKLHRDGNKPAAKIKQEAVLSKGEMTLTLAKEMASAVEKIAAEAGESLVIAVVDSGANLVLLHSMDNAFILSCDAARKKAYTAAALKMPTHRALELSKEGQALEGLVSGGEVLLLGGGYPLIYKGRLFGAVAVSGASAEEDAKFAEFASLYFEKRME